MNEPRKIWLNKPQREAFLIRAHEHYHVWARGTGKTEGPIAFRSIHNANVMPRGATGMVAATYMQILTRTLPPLEKAWQRYGYMPDVHYWVGKYPPKNLKIKKAIYHPRSPEHCVFWWNGHVRHFMSLDRPGLANGKTVDSIDGDEARFMNFQRYLDDIAPTNRGNREIFGHLAEHHAVTFCTDMPEDQSGKWILDKEKEVNKRLITEILNIQLAYNDIETEYYLPRTTKPRRIYLARKLKDYAYCLNELRKGSVFYSEATSLENIAVLGEEQFKQWRRELKPNVYERAILNKRIIQVEQGFYPQLNLEKHTYDAFDYSYIDNAIMPIRANQFVQDSRCDADVNKSRPLDIAFDSNGYFNCMCIGQETPKEYRVLNALFIKEPDLLKYLCNKFTEYYRHHPTKEVNFIYDHTFMGTDATRHHSFADEITKAITAKGWKVKRVYIGQQPGHDTRYRMWGTVLKEEDRRVHKVRLNKTNCSTLLVALQRAAVRQTAKRFEKDKRDEARIHTVPPEEATHFTDAFDTLYIGKFKHQIGYALPHADFIAL
ncbi:hypothetical protein [Mucilaginibacter sp.]|uniref:hypothetical protein n=1 Tax=Mucilaginibacter sp. TaxID=1882438 RepID=UPI00260DDF54|nr:hypothetical protein [Mucilaginibacter sp.]MDB4919843.1 hypothetical protein [Mucilaginibacter sp.]